MLLSMFTTRFRRLRKLSRVQGHGYILMSMKTWRQATWLFLCTSLTTEWNYEEDEEEGVANYQT